MFFIYPLNPDEEERAAPNRPGDMKLFPKIAITETMNDMEAAITSERNDSQAEAYWMKIKQLLFLSNLDSIPIWPALFLQ